MSFKKKDYDSVEFSLSASIPPFISLLRAFLSLYYKSPSYKLKKPSNSKKKYQKQREKQLNSPEKKTQPRKVLVGYIVVRQIALGKNKLLRGNELKMFRAIIRPSEKKKSRHYEAQILPSSRRDQSVMCYLCL